MTDDDKLVEALLQWPATNGQGDGLSSTYVAALLKLAADRIEALKQHAPDALLRELRHRADMIAIVEQGCGGTLTFKEMANSAMSQARDMVRLIDAALKGDRP